MQPRVGFLVNAVVAMEMCFFVVGSLEIFTVSL